MSYDDFKLDTPPENPGPHVTATAMCDLCGNFFKPGELTPVFIAPYSLRGKIYPGRTEWQCEKCKSETP